MHIQADSKFLVILKLEMRGFLYWEKNNQVASFDMHNE